MDSLFQPLGGTIASLVRGASVPQQLLDAAYLAQLREWSDQAAALGLTVDDPLLQAVAPPYFRFTSTQIAAQIALESRRELGADVSARLSGAVVCRFFEARYGSSESRWNRLSLEVVAVPTQRLWQGANP